MIQDGFFQMIPCQAERATWLLQDTLLIVGLVLSYQFQIRQRMMPATNAPPMRMVNR